MAARGLAARAGAPAVTRPAGQRAEPAPDATRAGHPACERALRVIVRSCRADIARHVQPAAGGDAASLHGVRIALVRLRTAIRFFRPVIDWDDWEYLQKDARWLNRRTGPARDLDVALTQRKGAGRRTIEGWEDERTRSYDAVRTALTSARYRRFMQTLAQRAAPLPPGLRSGEARRQIAAFYAARLERWRHKLVRHRDELERMGTRKRHRLRLRAKRFRYALDFLHAMPAPARATLDSAGEKAHIIQTSLGKLNDAATHRRHARRLRLKPLSRMTRYERPGSRRRLLAAAKAALERLAKLQVDPGAATPGETNVVRQRIMPQPRRDADTGTR